MKIIIDTGDIAHAMASSGIKQSNIKANNFEGYTDALVNALGELYELEEHITTELKTIEVCPECESADWDEQDETKICNACGLEF